MDENWSSKLLRIWSTKLFIKPFRWLGFSANKITTLNFIFFAIPAVYFFSIKNNWLALLFCIINIPIDYIDGAIARETTGYTKLGGWLDTSFDWLYQLGIIGAVGYANNSTLGILALISNVFANYISAHTVKKYHLFPFELKYYIFFGALFNQMIICLWLIFISSTIRSILLFNQSIKEMK